VYHPYLPITAKPSLSLKFDEFTSGQRLYGLDKLILKNELQDFSLVSEHMTYEIFRRAGLAAPMTAHARVFINGLDSGIYLMREPIDKAFLRRNFGGTFDEGNLYEIENTRDFVFDPSYPKLDHEGVEGRNRGDLMKFAAAVRSATPDTVERDLAPYLDIDLFATFVAAEIATGHWDGFTGNNNNTYVYANPKDGRFVFLPWGADQAFRLSTRRFFGGFGGAGGFGALGSARSYLVQQLLGSRRFADRVSAEVERISQEPVWSQQALTDRLDAVERILATVEPAGRTGSDANRIRGYRSLLDAIIQSGRRN
jgi:spore coat protein CotH